MVGAGNSFMAGVLETFGSFGSSAKKWFQGLIGEADVEADSPEACEASLLANEGERFEY